MHANISDMHSSSDSASIAKSSDVKCIKVHKTALKSANDKNRLFCVRNTEICYFSFEPIPRKLERKVHKVYKVHRPGVNTRKNYFMFKMCKEAFYMYSKHF